MFGVQQFVPVRDLRRKYKVPNYRDCRLPRTHQNTEWQDVPGTSLTPRKWCILYFVRSTYFHISHPSPISWNWWSLRLLWMIIQWNNHQHIHRPLLGVFLQNGVICRLIVPYPPGHIVYNVGFPLIELILLGESEKQGAISDWRYLHNGSIMHIDL